MKTTVIKVLNAKLDKATKLGPTSSPYTVLKVGTNQVVTNPCKNGGLEPMWKESFTFQPSKDAILDTEIWINDPAGKDVKICASRVLLGNLIGIGPSQVSLQMADGKEVGYVILDATEIAPSTKDLSKDMIQPKSLNSIKQFYDEPMRSSTNKDPSKYQGVTVKEYYDDTNLNQLLMRGLQEVARQRPKNPVRFLGEFLAMNATDD